MMNNELYQSLEPKIGHKAATIALRSRYNMAIMAGIALAGVAILHATPISIYWLVSGGLAALMLVVLTIFICTKIQLARLISQRHGTKVAWYTIPGVVPIETFDKWLLQLQSGSKK
jgi:hypothetical protein